MKKLAAFLGVGAGLGTVAFFVALLFVPLCLSVYGIVLAFKASIILGIIVLLVEPMPFILGILAVFGHSDVAQLIARWLGL